MSHKTLAPTLTAEDIRFARLLFESKSQKGVRSSITRCYLDAGFPPRITEEATTKAAQRHVRKRLFREFYRELQQEAADHAQVSFNKIVQGIARVAFGKRSDLFDEHGALLPIKDWPSHAEAMVTTIETEEVIERVPDEEGVKRPQVTGHIHKLRIDSRLDALKLLAQLLHLIGPDSDAATQTPYPPTVIVGPTPEDL